MFYNLYFYNNISKLDIVLFRCKPRIFKMEQFRYIEGIVANKSGLSLVSECPALNNPSEGVDNALGN